MLRIINESVATAIAHGLGKRTEKRTLVHDLIDGTSDVLLLIIDNGVSEMITTSGGTHLMSEDFYQ